MWQFQWMLSFIPDSLFIWITYGLMTIGAGLYVASKLVTWIPLMGQYKLPAELIGIVVLLGGVYLFGGYGVEMAWRDKVRVLEEKVKAAELKSQEVKIQIQEKIVYKTKVVKEKETVYIDRIKEIAKEIDAKCEVDPRVIEELNKASEDPFKGDAK
jgi:hypothetical protein